MHFCQASVHTYLQNRMLFILNYFILVSFNLFTSQKEVVQSRNAVTWSPVSLKCRVLPRETMPTFRACRKNPAKERTGSLSSALFDDDFFSVCC